MTELDAVFTNARIVTPGGTIDHGWLGVRAGKIVAVEEGACAPHGDEIVHDLGGAWLGPGFIDVHIHGSAGIDVMDTDDTGLRSLSRYLAEHGVTSYLVGTYTLELDRIMNALDFIATAPSFDDGANVLGAYLEGPYISPVRKGAHPEELLRAIDREEITRILDVGVVRAMVFAPELADSEWLIAELVRRGVTAVMGHTDADYDQVQQGFAAGASVVTHTFSGMRGVHHRDPGTAGAALLLDGLVCEVIADGVHISPELMPLFWRMKGAQGIALITDAGAAGGMPEGKYRIGGRDVTVSGGVGRLEDGTISSSAKTFDHNFALFCRYAGVDFDEAWPAASLVPARIAGVADRKGSIEVGKDADLVALDADGTVVMSAVAGRVIRSAAGASV